MQLNGSARLNSKFYDRKLLQPGWAGLLTLEEAEYVKAHLEANPQLRRKWKIRGKGRIPLTMIAERAFLEEPQAARQHIQREQARAQRRIRSLAKTKAPNVRSEKVLMST